MPDRTQELISRLQLEPHIEGGWFRRTWCSAADKAIETAAGRRDLVSSIYYLLTTDSPVGHFHCNRSDILHYFHEGDAIEYFLIWPDGRFDTQVMGNDLQNGQKLQLQVPGGVWKASRLTLGPQGYGLISEAVSPGFDYQDMQLGSREVLSALCPQHKALIETLCKS